MITSVFTNNRSQAVRLPAIFRFPKETQKVFVRVVGVERVICPVEHIWDSFLMMLNSPFQMILSVVNKLQRSVRVLMLRYMLDTNIVIYTIKNKPPEVKVRFNAVATQLCVSSITVAELIYGAENSQNPIKIYALSKIFISITDFRLYP